MIKGVHALFYTTEPVAAREFLRDKLGFPYVDASGDGWLIFGLPEGDVGCHPADHPAQGVSFFCDDLDAEIADLSKRGVSCSPVIEEEWGRHTSFEIPGGGPVQLYQPKYDRDAKHHG
jgi:catechol 2,3-dioxygenase-like lactoylglutathione lyase family enzyme